MSQNKQHVECDVKAYPISAANFNCIIRLSTDVSPVAILFRLFLGMAVTPEECCLQSAIMLNYAAYVFTTVYLSTTSDHRCY